MRIALTGRMRRGKTTAAMYLVHNYDFIRVGFADKLKDIVRELRPDLYVPLNSQYVAKPRLELQTFGQVTKDALGQNVWLDYAMRRIEHYEDKAQQAGVQCNIVLDDLRFMFEAEGLRKADFKIAKIEGNAKGSSLLGQLEPQDIDLIGQNHESEMQVDQIQYDYLIVNDSTVDNLYRKIDLIVNDLTLGR